MRARYIDAHCHLADPKLADRIDDVIRACALKDIHAFVQGGIEPREWDEQLRLHERYPDVIFPCFGLHPWFVAGRMGVNGDELKAGVERGLKLLPEYLPRAVALGELGLDLGPKTDASTFEYQKEIFSRQLKIARELEKPLVLHIVHAHSDAIRLLQENGPYPKGGLVHSFSGSFEIGRQYLDLGFTLSIGGVVTRPGYETLKRGIQKIPLDRLVIESDSPDQTPDPTSLWSTAEAIVQLRGEAAGAAERILAFSTERLIGLFDLKTG